MRHTTLTKAVILLLAIMTVFCFASCGKAAETTHKMEPATYEKNISGRDAFEKGYYYEQLGSHKKVLIRKLDPDSYVIWEVYFTKEKLPEEEIEKLLEREPDITNNGEFDATNYDYVYFFCSKNSKNSQEPTEDMVMISYQATYA
jgi:hypothetical protein